MHATDARLSRRQSQRVDSRLTNTLLSACEHLEILGACMQHRERVAAAVLDGSGTDLGIERVA